MKFKMLLPGIFALMFSPTFAQLEELTPEEQRYRDSITALNIKNEAIANSQSAYNKGIKLFGEKKFSESMFERHGGGLIQIVDLPE